MEAIMYFKEKHRMTKKCAIYCNECPLCSENNGKDVSCGNLEHNYPEEAVAIVEKWSKEHPVLTNKAKFIKDHPNAPLDKNGYPLTKPYDVGYCKGKDHCMDCKNFRRRSEVCWDEPYEGDE